MIRSAPVRNADIPVADDSRGKCGEISQRVNGPKNDTVRIELPAPAGKTIDLEGRPLKDSVRKTLQGSRERLAKFGSPVRDMSSSIENVFMDMYADLGTLWDP
jgi:hypothetical protein